MRRKYRTSDLADYVNWLYFFHAWGLPPRMASIAKVHGCAACRSAWLDAFPDEERPKAREAMQLFADAQQLLSRLSPYLAVQAVVKLFPANSDGDDIVLYLPAESPHCAAAGEPTFRLPMLRQQCPDADGFCHCLADFIRPVQGGRRDTIGLFATSVEHRATRHAPQRVGEKPASASGDDYRDLLVQTLSDRLAEAAAERVHEEVRKSVWGYAPDERLTIDELHAEKFQGIRPAVGYPSLPDISLNFLLDRLLHFGQIGAALTEHAMMVPHASTSGLMLAHPDAHYFSVGRISEEQLADYAERRGTTPGQLRPYLAANLPTP